MKMYVADSLVAKLEAARNKLSMTGLIAAERNVAKFALQVVYDEPTVDAEPVRNGRWVWFENRPVTDADDPECIGCTGYECSECGNNEGTCIRFYEELSPDMLARIKEGLMEFLTNYCPNCGAKMDGGEEDENA